MKIDVKIQNAVHNVICNCTVRLQIVNWLTTENKRPFEIMLNTALNVIFLLVSLYKILSIILVVFQRLG